MVETASRAQNADRAGIHAQAAPLAPFFKKYDSRHDFSPGKFTIYEYTFDDRRARRNFHRISMASP
jgi:hypothetical protein